MARYTQFLLFSPVSLKRLLLQTCKNQGLFGKGLKAKRKVKSLKHHPRFSQLWEKKLRKTLLKKRKMLITTFSPFPRMFYNFSDTNLVIYHLNPLLYTHFDASTKNIVGKEEIARNEQFLLFPQCFSTISDTCHCIPNSPYF